MVSGRKAETDPYAVVYDAIAYGCKMVGDIEIHTGIGPLRIRDEIKRLLTMKMICIIPGTTDHYRVRKDGEDAPDNDPAPVRFSRPSEIGFSLSKELMDLLSNLPEGTPISAAEAYGRLIALHPQITELSDQHYIKHQTAAIMRTLVGKGLNVTRISIGGKNQTATQYVVNRGSRMERKEPEIAIPATTNPPKPIELPTPQDRVNLDIVEDPKSPNLEKISVRRNEVPRLKTRFTVVYRGLLVGCDSIEDLNNLAERNEGFS